MGKRGEQLAAAVDFDPSLAHQRRHRAAGAAIERRDAFACARDARASSLGVGAQASGKAHCRDRKPLATARSDDRFGTLRPPAEGCDQLTATGNPRA